MHLIADPAVHGPTSYPLLDIDAVRGIVARWSGGQAGGQAGGSANRWAIATCDEDQLVGTCGFHRIDPGHGDAELGYEIAPAHWGRGLATSSVRAAVNWAFTASVIRRIHAYVWVGNVASIRVLEKSGFQREGVLRAFRVCRGEPRDYLLYARLRGE